MRKVLIYFFFYTILLSFGSVDLINAQPATPIAAYKSWQVKGFAKSALRFGDYQQAATFLSEWLRRDRDNIKVACLLGYCHERNRNYDLAAHLYDSLYNASPRTNTYASYRLGVVNKYLGHYDEAISNFTQASKQSRKITTQGVSRKAIRQQIEGCNMGIRWSDTITNTGIERLNESINHPHKETGPLIIDDNQIIYGSTLMDHFEQSDLLGLDRPVNKTYSAILDSGIWKGGYPPPPPINGMDTYDWAKGTYSLDKKRFYASYCAPNLRGKMQCEIYVSEEISDKWSTPVALENNVNLRRFSSSQPSAGTCYDPRLEVIYFTSDRHGGAGKKDIWFIVYNRQTQTYSKAQNAGVFINTSEDEMSPFYDLTSHQLYFSSGGWTGIGGMDIFRSKGDMVTWEEPENVGMPLNSSFDDLDYTQSESAKMGFIASNRPDPDTDQNQTCCDDLFIFSESVNPRLKISGRLLKQNKAESLERLLGKDINRIDLPEETIILANKIITINSVQDSSTLVFLKQTMTDENGNFSMWVEKGANYKIIVKDTTLLATSFDFSTKNSSASSSTELKIEIAPLESRPINNIEIRNIYYDFGSSDLSPDACIVLDTTLLALMKHYPHITVEIGSHTDDKGGERYNLRLSEKRAAGVVEHLIEKGISAKRLQFKGYGMSHPIAPNSLPDGTDNPQGRQQNRRTEFKIIGVLSE